MRTARDGCYLKLRRGMRRCGPDGFGNPARRACTSRAVARSPAHRTAGDRRRRTLSALAIGIGLLGDAGLAQTTSAVSPPEPPAAMQCREEIQPAADRARPADRRAEGKLGRRRPSARRVSVGRPSCRRGRPSAAGRGGSAAVIGKPIKRLFVNAYKVRKAQYTCGSCQKPGIRRSQPDHNHPCEG